MKYRVAIIGEFQKGKSTFINCIFKQTVAATGFGLATTKVPVFYKYGQNLEAVRVSHAGSKLPCSLDDVLNPSKKIKWKRTSFIEVYLREGLLEEIDIIDTPGADAEKADTEMALDIAKSADFLILLMTKGFPVGNKHLIRFLEDTLIGKPYGLILNCGKDTPTFPNSSANKKIETNIISHLTEEMGLLTPVFSSRINLHWVYSTLVLESKKIMIEEDWSKDEVLNHSGFNNFFDLFSESIKTMSFLEEKYHTDTADNSDDFSLGKLEAIMNIYSESTLRANFQ